MTGLNANNQTDRKRIRDILKVWFANGVLSTEIREDEQRKKREFVVPGQWNEEMDSL